MKTAKILYWIVTSLMAAFMLHHRGSCAGLPKTQGVGILPQAVSIFGHLGYPVYLLPFLGTAKTLGAYDAAVEVGSTDRLIVVAQLSQSVA